MCKGDDPRRIPYLLAWKDEKHDGTNEETVRLTCHTSAGGTWVAELKRTDGSITVLRIVSRTLPRNGGRRLFLRCPALEHPAPFRVWEINIIPHLGKLSPER